jgi:hypothetical protein
MRLGEVLILIGGLSITLYTVLGIIYMSYHPYKKTNPRDERLIIIVGFVFIILGFLLLLW